MSAGTEEASIADPVHERPSAELGKARRVRVEDLGYRFIAGALTSIAAGALTIAFGARVGGVLLAFPAIMAASLTLIAEQENSAQAREDARGAVIGSVALALFAAVAALTLTHLVSALAMLLATITWFIAAFVGYLLAWFR
jgi:Protein of unknown function (DUF3147)